MHKRNLFPQLFISLRELYSILHEKHTQRILYFIHHKKVNLVIAGKFGGTMESALKEKEIKFREESDKKVEEVI